MQLFPFSLKMSITGISFYWRHDTPSFVIWCSRPATAPDIDWLPPLILLRIVIHGGQFTGGVHPPNQFVPEIVSPLPCSPALVHHTLLIVYFFKELISFMDSLDKRHTSIFNALINNIVGKGNKRAMMALDQSPESFSLQMNSTSLFLWF